MLTSLVATLLLTQAGTDKDWRWGVTLDSTSGVQSEIASLSGLSQRVTARIVFDPQMLPSDYLKSVQKLHAVADIMGEPIDSEPTNTSMTVDEFRLRMSMFMDKMGSNVDIWEIGNEVNGDWTGPSETMAAKIAAAFDEAKTRKVKTALTLFYDDDFEKTDREMVAWSKKYLPSRVKKGVDFVLISFYPTSATGTHPDWRKRFAQLAVTYPNAKLGFGELGLAKPNGNLSTDPVAKAALIRRYYTMANPLPGRYIGGYFWWAFRQDAVPSTKTLWSVFHDVIK